MKRIVAAILCILIVAGCTSNGPSESSVDDRSFTVSLEENMSTGYSWSYVAEPDGILTEISSEYLEDDSGLNGAPGTRVFKFEPISDGEVTLTFSYSRAWESKLPIKTYTAAYRIENGTAVRLKDAMEEAATETLTPETAEKFIEDVLSSFVINGDNTVSFEIPDSIPEDEEGKTELQISLNVTYVVGPGSYASERFLDYETNWSAGDTYSADIQSDKGETESIMLRVAFMTRVEDNAYKQYAADYIELTAPFEYGKSFVGQSGSVFNVDKDKLSAVYTTDEGRRFEISFKMPEGITAADAMGYVTVLGDNGAQKFDPIAILKDGEYVGMMMPMRFGATDSETLSALEGSAQAFPMMVYSSLALSNVVEWEAAPSEYYNNNGTVSCITCPMIEGEEIAECVLAYNVNSEPYYMYTNFKVASLTSEELTFIAKSVTIAPKEAINAFAALGATSEKKIEQTAMPTETDWAGDEQCAYFQSVIDTLDISDVTDFAVISVPSDEEVEEELNLSQTEELLALIKSLKLSPMTPENPATGGSTAVRINTFDTQLFVSYNGNWLIIGQSGQDKAWIFDGSAANEEFGKIYSIVWDTVAEK